MIALVIFIAQLSLVFFKHLTVRAVTDHNVLKSMIFTAMIQISWLVSSALGINALLNSEYFNIFAYVAGGVVGTFLNFKIKV